MTNPRPSRSDVDAYDAEWQKAMGAGDIAALRRLLLPDAVVVHHDGRVETGLGYLDRNEQGGGARIIAFAMAEGQTIRFHDTVVITGKMDSTVAHGEQRRPLSATVTRTWVRADTGWSLVALASSGH